MKFFRVTFVSQKTMHPSSLFCFEHHIAAETKAAAKVAALEFLRTEDASNCMYYKAPRLEEITPEIYAEHHKQPTETTGIIDSDVKLDDRDVKPDDSDVKPDDSDIKQDENVDAGIPPSTDDEPEKLKSHATDYNNTSAFSFRMTEQTRKMLTELSKITTLRKTALIKLAVMELHKKYTTQNH